MRTGVETCRSGKGDYFAKGITNKSYQGHEFSNPSFATRGHSHSSLTKKNGYVDRRNLGSGYLGDRDSIISRQESHFGHGDQHYKGVPSPAKNNTSTELRRSPQFDLRPENGFHSSQEGHHISKALPRNYGIDSCFHPNVRLGMNRGQDRERMKEELANSNSMAKNGAGILPGGIVQDRSSMSHVLWRGTRSDTNSSIRQPGMFSSTALSETSSTTPYLNGGRSGINANIANTRGSHLKSEENSVSLRPDLAEENNHVQGRPTASWNSSSNIGAGDGRMTMAELEKEKQLTGAKRLKQEVYRASLERQVEQKNRRIAEEVRESNAHPLGSGYTQAKPTFWQASTQVRANRPEDIPLQKRLLVQNSSTRLSQYEVPCDRVTQALTNLQNSRTSPDTYHSQIRSRNAVEGGGAYGMRNQPAQPLQVFPPMPMPNYQQHPSYPAVQQPYPWYPPPQHPGYLPQHPQMMNPQQGYPPVMNPQQGPAMNPYQQQQQYPAPNQYMNYPNQRDTEPERSVEPRRKEFSLEDIEVRMSEIQKQLREEDSDALNRNHESLSFSSNNSQLNPLKPSQSMYSDVDRLKNFIDRKLAQKDVDFDELRNNIFGRPNNWKTTDTIIDMKPLKDMINRAELAQQIKINQMKKAMQEAQEREEEERLDKKIEEYNRLQKMRDEIAEAGKKEWMRNHNLNKKVVSNHFIANNEELRQKGSRAEFQQQREPRSQQRFDRPHRNEDPETTLARKIGNRSRSESRSRCSDLMAAGDRSISNLEQRDKDSEYSYVKYLEEFSRNRPSSPPIPTLCPKANEDTLKGKLIKDFSRPRLSPSMLQTNRVPDLRRRIAVENELRNKISSSSV